MNSQLTRLARGAKCGRCGDNGSAVLGECESIACARPAPSRCIRDASAIVPRPPPDRCRNSRRRLRGPHCPDVAGIGICVVQGSVESEVGRDRNRRTGASLAVHSSSAATPHESRCHECGPSETFWRTRSSAIKPPSRCVTQPRGEAASPRWQQTGIVAHAADAASSHDYDFTRLRTSVSRMPKVCSCFWTAASSRAASRLAV